MTSQLVYIITGYTDRLFKDAGQEQESTQIKDEVLHLFKTEFFRTQKHIDFLAIYHFDGVHGSKWGFPKKVRKNVRETLQRFPLFSRESGFVFRLKSKKVDEFDVLVDFVRAWREGSLKPYCGGLDMYSTNKMHDSKTIRLNNADASVSGWYIDCESG